jgi:response regulator of citrate/malate metabolism
LIRPFDPENVRQGILDDKFKNKELVLALEQALDPSCLDFLFKTPKRQNSTRKKKQSSHTDNNALSTEMESAITETEVDCSVDISSNTNEQQPSAGKATLKRMLDKDSENGTDKKKCVGY